MNESFRQITIHPALPCVYHGCKGQATDAIVYEVSEREWRMVPTCERHTVTIAGRNTSASDFSQREEGSGIISN